MLSKLLITCGKCKTLTRGQGRQFNRNGSVSGKVNSCQEFNELFSLYLIVPKERDLSCSIIQQNMGQTFFRMATKPGKLKEFEKLSESQGNLNFCRKAWKIQGKCKVCHIIANYFLTHLSVEPKSISCLLKQEKL